MPEFARGMTDKHLTGKTAKTISEKRRGSLTVEAALVFPLFVVLLISFIYGIKIICIRQDLHYAVNETARQISSVSYPLSFLNGLEDDAAEAAGVSSGDVHEVDGQYDGDSGGQAGGDNIEGLPGAEEYAEIIKDLFSFADEDSITGDEGLNTADLLSSVMSSAAGILVEKLSLIAARFVWDTISGPYWEAKHKAEHMIAATMAGKYLAYAGTPLNRLEVTHIKFPQSRFEYEYYMETDYPEIFNDLTGQDASVITPEPDDLIICAEYIVQVDLPFIRSFKVILRQTAVVRPWLNGYERDPGNFPFSLLGSDSAEVADNVENQEVLEDLGRELSEKTVYITKTGT
ncbi:MAG: pilus assembly protein, partial [Eubacteriales bacterium]|nr:pilus assembly protein [Eubacteriales bacterium]